ncbi:MAG: hypothetical protein V4857_16930 [Pseudomonadota bacterium]
MTVPLPVQRRDLNQIDKAILYRLFARPLPIAGSAKCSAIQENAHRFCAVKKRVAVKPRQQQGVNMLNHCHRKNNSENTRS